jgi:RimJ/RimL family protein N-acetyltransferase
MEHDLTLAAHGITLVPLALDHAPALLDLIDEGVWAGMTSPLPRTVADVEATIRNALTTPGRYAFAVLGTHESGRPRALSGQDATDVPGGAEDEHRTLRGTTSFYDVTPDQLRLEVGHTYYGRQWWGGSTNPACKLALLTHAFEVWGMYRVALRADSRNSRSIGAMRRLGAVPEGVLRGHRSAADGTRADTAYFSVLAPEWPAVRDGLLRRLEG